jgi:hypothetical protein
MDKGQHVVKATYAAEARVGSRFVLAAGPPGEPTSLRGCH